MFKKAEKIPLTNNADVDTEHVMLEITTLKLQHFSAVISCHLLLDYTII